MLQRKPDNPRPAMFRLDRSAAFDDEFADRDADRAHRIAGAAIEAVIQMLFHARIGQSVYRLPQRASATSARAVRTSLAWSVDR